MSKTTARDQMNDILSRTAANTKPKDLDPKPDTAGYSTLIGRAFHEVRITPDPEGSSQNPRWQLEFDDGDPISGDLADVVLNVKALRSSNKKARRNIKRQRALGNEDTEFSQLYTDDERDEAYGTSIERGNRPTADDLAKLPEWVQQLLTQRTSQSTPENAELLTRVMGDPEPDTEHMNGMLNEQDVERSNHLRLDMERSSGIAIQSVKVTAAQRATNDVFVEQTDFISLNAHHQHTQAELPRTPSSLMGPYFGGQGAVEGFPHELDFNNSDARQKTMHDQFNLPIQRENGSESVLERRNAMGFAPGVLRTTLRSRNVKSDMSIASRQVTVPVEQQMMRDAFAERLDVIPQDDRSQRARVQQEEGAPLVNPSTGDDEGTVMDDEDDEFGFENEDAVMDEDAGESAFDDSAVYRSPTSAQKKTSVQVFHRPTGQRRSIPQPARDLSQPGLIQEAAAVTNAPPTTRDLPEAHSTQEAVAATNTPPPRRRPIQQAATAKPTPHPTQTLPPLSAHEAAEVAEALQLVQELSRLPPIYQPTPRMRATTSNPPAVDPAAHIAYGRCGVPRTERSNVNLPPSAAQSAAFQPLLTSFATSILWHRYCITPPATETTDEFEDLTSNVVDDRGVRAPKHPVPAAWLERVVSELNSLFEVCRPDMRRWIWQAIETPRWKGQDVHDLLAREVRWVRSDEGPWGKERSVREIGLLLECVGVKCKGTVWEGV